MWFKTLILGIALVTACSPTEPSQHRVLGTIAGFDSTDPHVVLSSAGTAVTVGIRTYGNGCYSVAETVVDVDGLEATVTPYDYDPGCFQRDLKLLDHSATISFPSQGTALIRVKGLDVSKLSGTNLQPDTLLVERTIEIE